MATVTIATRSRKGGKSYVVQYLDPDTGRKKYHASFRRKDMAQQEANKLRIILDDGQLPEPRRKRRELKAKTFAQIAALCRAEWQRREKEGTLRPKTVEGYLGRLKALEAHWGDALMDSITLDGILDYRAEVAASASKVLANRRLFVLKQVFAKARELGVIADDPTSKVRYLNEREHERKAFMYPDKVDELLRAAANGRAKHYLPLAILLAVEHGASKQEILDLTWDDVTLDYGETGVIRFHRTKTDVERVHRIMPRTRQALLDRREHLADRRASRGIEAKGNHVVGHLDGTRLSGFKSAWKRACQDIGMDGFHFHDNRHTFCSNIIMAGGTLKHAKEMIGHKTLRMTDRYSHLEAARDNPIQAALAAHYAAAK